MIQPKRQPPPESQPVVITSLTRDPFWGHWESNTGLRIEYDNENSYDVFTGEQIVAHWWGTDINITEGALSNAEQIALIQEFFIKPWQERIDALRKESLIQQLAGLDK